MRHGYTRGNRDKHMKRRWFNIMAVFSLLLCAATVGLWVRSYSVIDRVECNAGWNSSTDWRIEDISIGSSEGHFEFIVSYSPRHIIPLSAEPFHITHSQWPSGLFGPPGRVAWNGCGFYQYTVRYGMIRAGGFSIRSPDDTLVVHDGVPYWFIMAAFAGLPGWWIYRRRSRRGIMIKGHCVRCGYDLRASKERCPECGTLIAVTTGTEP